MGKLQKRMAVLARATRLSNPLGMNLLYRPMMVLAPQKQHASRNAQWGCETHRRLRTFVFMRKLQKKGGRSRTRHAVIKTARYEYLLILAHAPRSNMPHKTHSGCVRRTGGCAPFRGCVNQTQSRTAYRAVQTFRPRHMNFAHSSPACFQRAGVLACLRACCSQVCFQGAGVPACLRACMLACLRAFLPACFRGFVPACLRACSLSCFGA